MGTQVLEDAAITSNQPCAFPDNTAWAGKQEDRWINYTGDVLQGVKERENNTLRVRLEIKRLCGHPNWTAWWYQTELVVARIIAILYFIQERFMFQMSRKCNIGVIKVKAKQKLELFLTRENMWLCPFYTHIIVLQFLVPKLFYCCSYYYVWIKYKLPHSSVSQILDQERPLKRSSGHCSQWWADGASLQAPEVWDKLFSSQQTYMSSRPWLLAVTWQKFDPEFSFFLLFKF